MPSDNPVVAGAAPSEVHARADDTVSLQGQASQESLHFRSEATGQSAAIQPAMARAADCMPAAKEGFHGMWPAAGEGMASPAACQEVSNADHWRSKLGDSTSCQWWHDASAAHGTSAYPWTPQLLATSHDTGEAPLLLASPHATGQAPQLLATTHGIGQAPQLQQHHQHQGSVLTSPAVFSGLDTTPLATQQRVQPVCDVDRDPASLQVQSKQEQMPLLPYTNMSHISMPHHPGASVGVPASCHHTVSSLPPFLQQGSSLDHHGLLQQGQLPVVSDADDTNDEFAEMLQLLGA